nr:serine/arginine repetitive matrix protein 1-like isoform X2 [Halyomorpha halys]
MARPPPRLRTYRTMTAICFVCNLPILSHQVGLVWQGGNGWDDLMREQLEESTLRQSVDLYFRLGPGRRDSAAQINAVSPPTETRETSPPPARRRRSSLAQLTDILREWGGGSGGKAGRGSKQAQLVRRETLADLARSLPWSRGPAELRKRRESSADSGVKSASGKSSAISDFRSDIARLLGSRRDSTVIVASPRRGSGESGRSGGRRDSTVSGSRRGSGESSRSHHHHHHHHHHRSTRRRQDQQRPSTSSTASDAPPPVQETIQPPTIITSSPVSPIAGASAPFPVASSPTAPQPPAITSPQPSSATPQALTTTAGTPTVTTTTTTQATTPGSAHPLLSTRRDSTTQVYYKCRRDSRSQASPERRPSTKDGKYPRLTRQSTAIDDSCWPGAGRRGSQPTLSPDPEEAQGRKARRDSLSPDSASCAANRPSRRDSRASRLSPDRAGGDRDPSPRRSRLRRQSSSMMGRRGSRSPRSPESSSTCSSRDASPCKPPPPPPVHAPIIRRQSTTEEILIARGFRRQSTTEEMIRCRNFRRQSSQSEDCCRYRGRRDSSAQIIDGTLATMTVETTSTFFDSSTQTGTV